MIVVCPSCQRRYRHDFESDAAAPTAHCSACDERFRLTLPKRTYVLAAGGETSTAPRFPIGMGVPAASASLQETGADDGRVIVDDLPVSTDAETVSGIEIELPAADDLEPAEEVAEPAAEAAQLASEASTDARPRAARRRGSILEPLVAFLPGGIGAGMAYHFAGPWDQDPVVWAALGGAIGLLLGWACLLWITRGD
jgi:hypothetical protein